MQTRFSHSMMFGVAAAIATIVLGLLVYLIASDPLSSVNFLSYPITITIACIGVKKWRDQSGGFLTYGKTYVHLLLQAIPYVVITSIWTFIFFSYIAPGAIESMQLRQEVQFEEEGMSQAQIDTAMRMIREWQTPPVMAISSLIMNLLMYGIIYLIVAAIMKKDPPQALFMPPSDVSNPNMPPPQNFPPQQ